MRGEDALGVVAGIVAAGSPPHARGRPRRWPRGPLCGRITPACAGKTWSRSMRVDSFTDHPRMRGEDFFAEDRVVPRVGSPPHARGRRRAGMIAAFEERITPACAGKTLSNNIFLDGGRDHPRMRGEDGRCICDENGMPWITPACAGKTVRLPRESDKVVFQLTSFPSLPT